MEYDSSDISIKHDVRIGRIVIHVGIELPAVAVFKGVADELVLAYPCELPVYGLQKCQYGKGDADKQASELSYHGLVLLSTPDSSMIMNVRFFDVMFMFTLF